MIKKINNLQALRAFAAINVVLFHIIGGAPSYGFGVDILNVVEGWGANGVDVFFVLSGFIMVYIQKEKKISPARFFIDRLTRIAPLYWLLTLLVLALTYLLPSVFRSDVSGVKEHTFYSLLFISQPLLGRMPVLYDGWSLEYEMLFYLFFAIGLIFAKKSISYLFVIISISFLTTLGVTQSIAIEFLIGVFLGCLYLKRKLNELVSKLFLFIGMLCFGLTLLIFKLEMGIFGNRIFLYGIPSFFMIYGLLGVRQIKSGLITKLGDASYSIYLIQVFTVPAFYKFVFVAKFAGKFNADFLALSCLVLTVIAGWFTYEILEKRLTPIVRSILG